MSVVVVGALEVTRTRRTLPVAAMCVAGVVGTWTLPQLGIAFLAVGAVVALNRDLRRAAVVGIAASVMAVLAWYAPHLRQCQ